MNAAENSNHKITQNVMSFITLFNNSILLALNLNFVDGSMVLQFKRLDMPSRVIPTWSAELNFIDVYVSTHL